MLKSFIMDEHNTITELEELDEPGYETRSLDIPLFDKIVKYVENKPSVKFIRRHELSVLPSRAGPLEVGMDLVAVERLTSDEDYQRTGVAVYDTGIIAVPDTGYYLDLVPRSSIIKTNWMLANTVGIIDETYRGTIRIAMTPRLVRNNTLETPLEPPFKMFQLIMKRAVYPTISEISMEYLDQTTRGEGGFGSTGQ